MDLNTLQLCNTLLNRELSLWNTPINNMNDVAQFVQYFVNVYNFFSPHAQEIEQIVAQRLNVNITVFQANNAHAPWFANFKANNPMYFWGAYTQYLLNKGQSVAKVDIETDAIMDRLPLPNGQAFTCRGMVVGYVQSGKTSNFIGLINKAADSGYKLIVILSGMYNDLRSQTQKRVDEGFTGRYTDTNSQILQMWANGTINHVGNYRPAQSTVSNLTSSNIDGDVNGHIAIQNAYNPNLTTVIVTKKNTHSLEALLKILYSGQLDQNGHPVGPDVPLLVIDDEADSAGIDTNYDDQLTPADLQEASTINKKIRSLLTMFKQAAYVGYTATPYANFLIDKSINSSQTLQVDFQGQNLDFLVGEGLFPKDFVACLEHGDGYMGPEAYFGDKKLPITNIYDEATTKACLNPRNGNITQLPSELYAAINNFILSTAIRRLRGDVEQHSSMLVHASYLIDQINQIAQLITQYTNLVSQAYMAGAQNAYDATLSALYVSDYQNRRIPFTADHHQKFGTPAPINYPWHQVQNEVRRVLRKLVVMSITSDENLPQAGRLNYQDYENQSNPSDNGLYVIAVGGNCLSRGLTLEGLCCSYFYRNSKAYDTLMQMARWFGYRRGYYDLCRIYLSRRICGRFIGMCMADYNLRENVVKKLQAMRNVTPENYVMCIEVAAGMKVTGDNRTGAGRIARSQTLVGKKETNTLPITNADRVNLQTAVTTLLNNIMRFQVHVQNRLQYRHNHYWWTHVPARHVIDFVRAFNLVLDGQGALQPNLTGLDVTIQNSVNKNELTEWTVVLLNNSTRAHGVHIMGAPINAPINLHLRSKNDWNIPNFFSRSKGISQGGDCGLDFTDAEIQNLTPINGQTLTDSDFAQNRPDTRGLLVIYPMTLDAQDPTRRTDFESVPQYGYMVSLPSGILPNNTTVVIN